MSAVIPESVTPTVPPVIPAPLPPTGGSLQIQPAGTLVAVDESVLVAHERLVAMAGTVATCRDGVVGARALEYWPSVVGAPPATAWVDLELDHCVTVLSNAAAGFDSVSSALDTALVAYGIADAGADAAAQAAANTLAGVLGALAPTFLLLAATNPLVLMGLVLGAPHAGPALSALGDWIEQNPRATSNPVFVEAVRLIAGAADDGIVGALTGVPGLGPVLGEHGLGVTGTAFAGSAILVGGQPFGLFRETGVTVSPARAAPATSAPRGTGERIARVPEVNQVRIERYDAPGKPPRYEVYIGPTETFSPVADGEPWDMTSNIGAVALQDAASIRAVEMAMEAAGITPDDEVQITGFSQGGVVGANIAASGDWNVVGFTSFGGPTGTVDLPDGLDGMLVRNTDDPIPALGGPQGPTDMLQIERRAFAPGDPLPNVPAAAHHRNAYDATAQVIDASESAEVQRQIANLDAFGGDYLAREGGTVTSYAFHADRT